MATTAPAAQREAAQPPPESRIAGYQTFVQLERAARAAPDLDALRLTIVNETRRLLGYQQAILLIAERGGARFRVKALSSLPTVDREAPMVRWLERLAGQLAKADDARSPRALSAADVADADAGSWSEWLPAHALWCPLLDRDGSLIGVLWLARNVPWREAELVLAERLADAYAHAWQALGGRRRRLGARVSRRPLVLVLAVLLLAALALPVRQSVLAPAEIVASEPDVAAAPMAGVIETLHVRPDEEVAPGQPLFSLDATELEQQREIAAQALEVARAQYRRQSQVGMIDPQVNQELAVLEGQIALRAAELGRLDTLLEQVTVRARRAGVAVFGDASDWEGRPVSTGERVMLIADPERTQLRIALSPADAMVLEEGAPVRLFLDVDPLDPVEARVTRASYEAKPNPDGTLAYTVAAAFSPDHAPRRLGLRGTAKIYGERVSLFFYLFRRPLAWLRQALGI